MAVLSTAAAGVVHLAAADEHRDVSTLVVAFFLLTAVAQLSLAVALARGVRRPRGTHRSPTAGPAPVWLVAAIGGTVAVVVLYVVVHSTDLLAGFPGLDHGSVAQHAGSAAGPGHPIETEGPISLSTPSGTVGEPPDTLGLTNVAVELLAIAAYTALLSAAWRRWATNALLVLGGLIWVLWLTGGLA